MAEIPPQEDVPSLKRDFSLQRKAFLRPSSKLNSVDESTGEPNKFLKSPRVITLIRNSSGRLKVWKYLPLRTLSHGSG